VLAVAHVLGLLLASFALIYALPVGCALLYGDGLATRFLLAAAITAAVGLILATATARARRELKPRDGFLLVTLGSLLLSCAAAVPLLLALPGLNFSGAFFEAMSGLTTTGSTVLNGLDGLPPSLNLWRHTLQWIGGLGIIVMALAVLPLLGVGGMQLYKGQAPGAVKDERLAPRITETAKQLWLVYTLITAAGIVALRICRMSWFDAVCHAFSAVGLGGFSTHDRSIAYFNSPAIELVLMALMVIAALNFGRHIIALRRLSLATYRQDPEAKGIFAILAVSVLGVSTLLAAHGVYPDFLVALRHAAFNVISQATTSGLTTEDFHQWPVFRALVDAVPLLHPLQHRLDRRRHQDVPHPAARAPGGARDAAAHPPGGRRAATHRRAPHPRRGGLLGARLHFRLLHDGGTAHLRHAAHRHELRRRGGRGGRLHQQHRARFRGTGSGSQFPLTQHGADLDMQRGDAARPARGVQRHRAVPPGLLAQVAPPCVRSCPPVGCCCGVRWCFLAAHRPRGTPKRASTH
jgi:hypothetical protein